MLDLLDSPKANASDLLAALGAPAIAQRSRGYAGPERRGAPSVRPDADTDAATDTCTDTDSPAPCRPCGCPCTGCRLTLSCAATRASSSRVSIIFRRPPWNRSSTCAGAVSGRPASKGGAGAYSSASCTVCAKSSPAISAIARRWRRLSQAARPMLPFSRTTF